MPLGVLTGALYPEAFPLQCNTNQSVCTELVPEVACKSVEQVTCTKQRGRLLHRRFTARL